MDLALTRQLIACRQLLLKRSNSPVGKSTNLINIARAWYNQPTMVLGSKGRIPSAYKILEYSVLLGDYSEGASPFIGSSGGHVNLSLLGFAHKETIRTVGLVGEISKFVHQQVCGLVTRAPTLAHTFTIFLVLESFDSLKFMAFLTRLSCQHSST